MSERASIIVRVLLLAVLSAAALPAVSGPLPQETIFADGFEAFDPCMGQAPCVVSTSPADGALHVPALTSIAVTFNEPMDAATITANTADDQCNGAVQLSDDSFTSCVPFAAQPATDDNIIFTATPLAALTSATTYQIRVTTTARNSAGNPLASDYTTPTGFTVRYAHTIVIDGSNDFISADEALATSTVGGNLFVSHDDLTLFVALEHPDIVVGGTGNKFTYFLFSTDDGLSSGNTTSSDGKIQFGAAGTARMLYHWKERIDGGSYSEYRIANGTDWNTDWGAVGKNSVKTNGFLEASFDLTEFGGVAPSDLIITAYTVDYDGDAGNGWIYNMLTPGSDGSGVPPRPLAAYLHLQLPSSRSPNDASHEGSF